MQSSQGEWVLVPVPSSSLGMGINRLKELLKLMSNILRKSFLNW